MLCWDVIDFHYGAPPLMMFRMVCRRISVGLLTLWLVSVIVFIGTEILPGDVAEIMLANERTPETLRALRDRLGLDRPPVIRYFEWLGNMISMDLGLSLAGRGTESGGVPIKVHLTTALPNTLLLAGIVSMICIPVSVLFGLLAAMYPASLYDRLITLLTMSMVCVPEFFIATLLVLIFSLELRVLPAISMLDNQSTVMDIIKYMTLPVLSLSAVMLAQMTRMTRATVLNVMSSPYIEMAILKGVSPGRVICRHALYNSISPIVNIVALNLAFLLSGVVIIENIFSYPGLGKLMVESVRVRDMPLVQACGMTICSTYLLLILMADIVSIIFNPRLRYPK